MSLSIEEKIHQIQHILLNEKDNKYFKILSTIIDNHKIEHTINTNGIFLNLSLLNHDIIDNIYFHFTTKDTTTELIEEVVEPKQIVTPKQKKKELKKDKLILEKFDKYLIQASRGNIYI